MKIKKLEENIRPMLDDNVKVKLCGNVVEVTYSSTRSYGGTTKKIDKDHYIDLLTGEYKEFRHHTTRRDDLKSVRCSLTALRDCINANVSNPKNCLFVTLTYKENMTDIKKLYYDFGNLNKKLRIEYGQYEYIRVIEPQGRGAWHLHIILIFSSKAPFIPSERLTSMWGKGFTSVKAINDNVDNIGAYLSAYLGDMELDEYTTKLSEMGKSSSDIGKELINRGIEEKEVIDENGEKQTKRFVKGARLGLYPAQTHIWSASKGITKPVVTYMKESKVQENYKEAAITYEITKYISNEDEGKDFRSFINKRYYNTKREKVK